MDTPEKPRLHLTAAALCFTVLWAVSAAHQSGSSAPLAFESAPNAARETVCKGSRGKPVARTELFFGLARPDGSTVAPDAFQQFVDQEVTPRFPDGLTLLGGDGQFRNANGAMVKEHAKLLILLYPYNQETSRNIESIRAAYAKAFQQESVLRVDGTSCAAY